MTEARAKASELSADQQALLAIRKLRARLDAVERARSEPIAVVGMGCRFPGGASSPDAYWRLMDEGRDAVGDIPPDRWDVGAYHDPRRGRPGTSYCRTGAFLDRIDGFDAHFFGIAPREARHLDPQQRLFLEVTWEALEHAGIAPDSLAGSRAGVFVGATTTDYMQLHTARLGARGMDAYVLPGNTLHAIAGRVAYLLGLQGPAMAIDTACSSSLVAIDRACRSLRDGESDLALAGGVSLMVVPGTYVGFSQWGMISPDGRCKTFDARADGFGRGEGCGAVVLKRLSDALSDGDRVLALLRGSAVNQDGASAGLSVPNGLAQAAVIREALKNAGVRPAAVGYVEAHGTGTELGDPLELEALAAVLGEGRAPDRPVLVGSVKTNIGHLEAAAGVAGLIKVILSLGEERIPSHLHFETPTPKFDWDRAPLRVPAEAASWPGGPEPRIAGVSGFGFSGTNVHLVVEEAPASGDAAEDRSVASPAPGTGGGDRPRHVLPLSARTEPALRDLASRYIEHLDRNPTLDPADLCFTAGAGRAHFAHRAAAVGATAGELRGQLEALRPDRSGAGPRSSNGLHRSIESEASPRVAFLFTGQGSQYFGMGRGLYEISPLFRREVDRCMAALGPDAARMLRDVMGLGTGAAGTASSPGGEKRIHRTEHAQPAIFALEWGLQALWRSWGVEPFALLGHSVGEYVAASAAGVFGPEEGIRLIAKRGHLMGSLPGGGRMVSFRADAGRVERAVGVHGSRASIAAFNGPGSVVVSGEAEAVAAIVDELAVEGIEAKELRVSHAFHSALLDPILDPLERAAGDVSFRPPAVRLLSNLTGRRVTEAEMAQPGYWRRHAREPVRFAAAMAELASMGVNTFVEVGPSPVLLGMGMETVQDGSALWLPSLRKGRDEWSCLLDAVGALYARGVDADWHGFDAPWTRRRVTLPTYPFQRERFWIERGAGAEIASTGLDTGHPLLGHRLRSASRERVYEVRLAGTDPSWLAGHRVRGEVVLPLTAYVEMGIAAARDGWSEAARDAEGPEHVARDDDGSILVEDLALHQPLVLPAGGAVIVQVVVSTGASGTTAFRVVSLTSGNRWRTHATGTVRPDATDGAGSVEAAAISAPDSPAISAPDPPANSAGAESGTAVTPQDLYEAMAARGLEYDGAFRGVRSLRRARDVARAVVELPRDTGEDPGVYAVHPAFLDACLQVVGILLPENGGTTYLPFAVDRIRVTGGSPRAGSTEARLRAGSSEAGLRAGAMGGAAVVADVKVKDARGTVLVEASGIRIRPVPGHSPQKERGTGTESLYAVRWVPRPLPGRAGAKPEADAGAEPPVRGKSAVRMDAAAGAMREALVALARGPAGRILAEVDPGLESLGTAYLLAGLRELGWSPRPGDRVDPGGLREELGILPRYGKLLRRVVEILEQDGVVRSVGEGWEVVGEVPDGNPEAIRERLGSAFPDAAGALRLASRCGRAFAGALRGHEDPLELLFPGGSTEHAESLYRDSPLTRGFNEALASGVAAFVARFPKDRPLRVLEIGAGTGGTTARVLPAFPADRTVYTFTDVSPLFLRKARKSLDDPAFVQYRTLDIGKDPGAQGFEKGAYDLIIAANVLHATPDLDRTLGHTRALLAEGGMALLLEVVRPQRFADLTVGLTDGWWAFEDGHRTTTALLPAERWLELLHEHGFGEARAVTGPGAFSRQAVLLASASRFEPGVSVPGASGKEIEGAWIVVGDGAGTGAGLVDRIRREGGRCAFLDYRDPALGSAEALGDTVRSAFGGKDIPSRGVVYLRALDLSPPDETPSEASTRTLEEEGLEVVGGALHLVQALVAAGIAPRLWLVTRGAQAALPDEGSDPRQAALWGFASVVDGEHPELRCTSVDLGPGGGEWAERIFEEIRGADEEERVALRAAGRRGARLVRWGPSADPPPQRPYRLVASDEGAVDALTLRPIERTPPGPGEVEIEVDVTALNFRDVLNVLGEYPGDPIPLGGECGGVITAVGDGVADFTPGDLVVAMVPGAFASHVVARAEWVVPKPPALTLPEAVTLPSGFGTAWHALYRVAGLREGERVLIHAATGGVGMAAVRLAQRVGAEVYATAGSPEKRTLLEELGVRNVFSSRTPGFATQILALTEGAGVDVVLNSLSGELIRSGLETLAPRGRFVELGRRGIWEASEVARLRPEASYHPIDLSAMAREQPAELEALLGEVMAAVCAEEIGSLPFRVFPLARAGEAFREMARAGHTGKLVITHPRPQPAAGLREDATYLVTGGLGGLGLLVARWLCEQGAKHLVLVSRTEPSGGARKAIEALEADGARVRTAAADVSLPGDVDRVLALIDREMPPLRGVIHAAGVLDEGTVVQQSWDRFARVFAPKVSGSWNLHVRTRTRSLDFFVLFSSGASLLGAGGLSNHSAACAFLDGLAHRRRAEGLPGLSIDWGQWSGVGAAVERDVEDRLGAKGVGAMTPEEGLAALSILLDQSTEEGQLAVLPVEWKRFLASRSPARLFLSGLSELPEPFAGPAPPPESGGEAEFTTRLEEATPTRRRRILAAHTRESARRALGLRAEAALNPRQPLQELGLDSLMAVELRNLLGAGLRLARPLPATLVFDHPTIDALVDYLERVVAGSPSRTAEGEGRGTGPDRETPGRAAQVDAAAVADLSDEEAEALLVKELEADA